MNDFPRKWHPLARRIPVKNKNGGKAPPLTLEGSGYHRVVVTLLLLFSGVRCAILNTRAGMHRYLYSIFYIFFQMLSHCDNTPAPGKDRIPDLAGGVVPLLTPIIFPKVACPPPISPGPGQTPTRSAHSCPPAQLRELILIPVHRQNLQWNWWAVRCLTRARFPYPGRG
jgi:hypothetical protein